MTEGPYKDGKKEGLHTIGWYENGQMEAQKTYKNNVIDGFCTWWYENGQKKEEKNYKDDVLIGKYEYWFDDGTKKWELYYNDDGRRDSTKLTTRWYESGQKWYKGYVKTLNDTTNVWIGLKTEWYENGNLQTIETLQNGKRIHRKCWDENDNEWDCN
jgi:antitoxin component YwqK of YwqJK toxin-antitoxin module